MNWMVIAWPMVTATCLTLALINLRIAMDRGRRAPHLFFSTAALSVAAVSAFEFALMQTEELVRYQSLLRWSALPIGIMLASVVGFIWSFFGTGRRWLAIAAILLNTVADLVNLLAETPVIRHAVALHETTIGGVSLVVPTVISGPWSVVEIVSVILAVLFVVDSSVTLWRRGGHRRAVIVGGSVVFFFIASRGFAYMVERGSLEMPYMVSFAFIGVIVAMAMELGDDVLRTASLSRELHDSQRRVDLAGQSASLGFWELDFNSNAIWANETARMLFGIPAGEPVDLPRFFACLHPDDREGVANAIKEAVDGRHDYEKEYRVLREGGEARWISARGRVEAGSAGGGLLMRGVLLDINEQRKSEAEMALLRGQLAHTGRVSTMGQLAAALAHELNQPLGAILRNAEAAELFLNSSSPDLDELRAIILDIMRDDRRACGVIDRLRALLKRKDIDPRPLSVKDLLDEVQALIRAEAAARGIRLDLVVRPGLPAMLGDRIHLQQVLINLIINAMDALGETDRAQRCVTIEADAEGDDFVGVSVKDTGQGIPGDRLAQVFDPFYTTKPNGMGMGLAICSAIIEAHRGRIGVESRDTGTVFRFTIPAVKRDPP